MKRIFIVLIIISLSSLLAIVWINLRVASYSENKVYDSVESVPSEHRVAIVLGARVRNDGPSNTLYDRVLTAAELYRSGKTDKLLMSGGGEEPAVMRELAIGFGVPDNDIILDDLGLRTYESCQRARQAYAVERAIIVTQDYHLARSLYLCQNLGIDTIGINAKRRNYDSEGFAWNREYLSRVLAWYDINF